MKHLIRKAIASPVLTTTHIEDAREYFAETGRLTSFHIKLLFSEISKLKKEVDNLKQKM